MSDEKLDTETRRGQIAAAALDLVAAGGVSRLSIAAVARRVGLVPSGIYRHFRNKEEVLAAALDLVEARLLDNAQAARQETTDPLGRLKSLLVRHVQFIREARAVPRIIFSEDSDSGHPDRLDRVRRIIERYLQQIEEFVRQGQHQGRIRTELDPRSAALLFFGMVVPAGMLWHLSDGQFDVARHADQVWQMFCAAIAAAARPRERGHGTLEPELVSLQTPPTTTKTAHNQKTQP